MSFFTAAQIAELRAVQESVMTDTCTISDGAHKVGQGQEWTPRGASVACGVSSLAQAIQTGQVTIVPDLPGNQPLFVFAFPYDTTGIEQGDRITWNGDVYEVRSVEEPGTYPMQRQVVAVRR